jgi:hypothetical protein
MPQVILSKKKRGNADVFAGAGSRRVPPKPYWRPIDDEKELDGQEDPKPEQSSAVQDQLTNSSTVEQVPQRKVTTFRARRRKRTSLWEEIVNDNTTGELSSRVICGLPQDLKVKEGTEKPDMGNQPIDKKRKLASEADRNDDVGNPQATGSIAKKRVLQNGISSETSLATPESTDTSATCKKVSPEEESLSTPPAQATGKEALVADQLDYDSNSLVQLLQYFPMLEQTLSGIHCIHQIRRLHQLR